MKKIICVVAVLCFINGFSQSQESIGIGAKGSVIFEKNAEIKGDIFIYNVWNKGVLVLKEDIFSRQDFIKYDAYNDRVLIKNMSNLDEVIEITDNDLIGFSIFEGESNLKHDFVKLNANHFESEGEEGFYEIVWNLEQTNYVLKRNIKIIYDPNKSKGTESINNFPLEYKDKNVYFLKNNDGLYVKIRLNKKDVKKVLTEHSQLVDSFIKTNKIKLTKESNVVKLANYYYSL